MKALFLDEINPDDEIYHLIRDDPECAETKAFVERLWEAFQPFADRNFQCAIARSFHSRLWEMYLAFGLSSNGAHLQPTPAAAPDLAISGFQHPIWIEATAPSEGIGADRVPEQLLGMVQIVPSDAPVLRYRSAIEEKLTKLSGYLEGGIVGQSDPYPIAINCGR